MIEVCNNPSQHKIVSVSENRRVFRINNPSRLGINTVKVDGCYISEGKRCDYLFEIIDDALRNVLYVELKGKHIEEAIEQLSATLHVCLSIHEHLPRHCYIVASRVPKASTSTQKYKKEFKRKYGVLLHIDTKLKEVTAPIE